MPKTKKRQLSGNATTFAMKETNLITCSVADINSATEVMMGELTNFCYVVAQHKAFVSHISLKADNQGRPLKISVRYHNIPSRI